MYKIQNFVTSYQLSRVMSAQIAGIGVGTFILFSIWLTALILWLISTRTEKIIGIIAFAIAITISLILYIIPKNSENFVFQEEQPYNYIFIWRNIFATILGLCSIGSIILISKEYFILPIKTSVIGTWITS